MTIFSTGVFYGRSRPICNFLDNALREINKPPAQFIVKWYWQEGIRGQFRVEFFGGEVTQDEGMKALHLLHSRASYGPNGFYLDA